MPSSNHQDNDVFLLATPAGVFEAFSSSEPTDTQLALQALLSHKQTMSRSAWLGQFSEQQLEDFKQRGWVEELETSLPAPNVALDKFLPYVVASLSGNRRTAIASDQGFCLARTGYTQDEADTLSVAAADFSGFLSRQQQRGWKVEGQAVSFYQHIDLLMPTTSLVFLWVDDEGYILIIDGEPLTNNRAFVEMIWSLKTSGLRYVDDTQEESDNA